MITVRSGQSLCLMNHAVKYVGLEELAVLVVWGHLMIEGGYYTITGEWI